MKFGAIIEKGLSDWQIVQQCDGFGRIEVSGKWFLNSQDKGIVFARIVKEDTGEEVIPWRKAQDTVENGWQIEIREIPAGGLYRLETCVKTEDGPAFQLAVRGDIVHFWGVGDLYVIAGQSNSAGYGKDPVYDPPETGVHLFSNRNQWMMACHPLNDSTGTMHEINREEMNCGNSPYLSFAKYVKREVHYPIGLIQTSLGGSMLSRWNPAEEGDLYANMIETVKMAGGAVQGILWYQGCSDATKRLADTYLERFEKVVESFRTDLHNPELPILTVQISRCTTKVENIEDEGWNIIQEMQRQAARKMKHVYIVPSLDFSLSDCIHISAGSNIILGERLAKLALLKIYQKPMKALAPDIVDAVQTSPDEVTVSFSNVYQELYGYDAAAERLSLEIEDQEGTVPLNEYCITDGNKYVLRLTRTIKGQAYIHNAKTMDPVGRIPVDFSTHLPLLAFYRFPVRS